MMIQPKVFKTKDISPGERSGDGNHTRYMVRGFHDQRVDKSCRVGDCPISRCKESI
jgi:hypothetical protein